jgi:hypothetical protein
LAVTRLLKASGAFRGELNALQRTCNAYLLAFEEKQKYELEEARWKALISIFHPEAFDEMFDNKPKVDEDGLTTWRPQTEADMAMAMEELKALGILS